MQGSGIACWWALVLFFFTHGKLFHLTIQRSSQPSFPLGAEKSNSPGAQGVIKVFLHAFLASPKSLVKSKTEHLKCFGERNSFNSFFFLWDTESKFSDTCFKFGPIGCFWNIEYTQKITNHFHLSNHYFIRQNFSVSWTEQALISGLPRVKGCNTSHRDEITQRWWVSWWHIEGGCCLTPVLD